jgi:hypothetical protein
VRVASFGVVTDGAAVTKTVEVLELIFSGVEVGGAVTITVEVL